MGIVLKINSASELEDAFCSYGRGNQFSSKGFDSLFIFLDEIESYELDVIALCCEFSEYTLEEIKKEYYFDSEDCTDEEIIQDLQDKTLVLKVSDNCFIVRSF